MEDEPRGVAIEEFVGLKPKMYSFLEDISRPRLFHTPYLWKKQWT